MLAYRSAVAVGCLSIVILLWMAFPVGAHACTGPRCTFLPLIRNDPPAGPMLGIALAYNRCDLAAQLGGRWVHNYSPTPSICPHVEAVPTIWGPTEIERPIYIPPGQPCWIMSFNEPNQNLPYGPGVSPENYAIYQRRIEERFPGCRIVSPGPSHDDIHWLERARGAYIARYHTPPRWDALAMHCYLYSWECQEMTSQYLQWSQAWGVPEIWITEFAALPCRYANQDAALADAEVFINWTATQPRITRLAWFAELIYGHEPWSFATCNPSLFNASLQQTAFGSLYQRITR